MKTEEKLEKIKKLADAMYYAAQHLTTDASRLHKAMEDYHQFIIHEYHKEEPTISDIVDEHWWEMLGEEPVSEDLEMAASKYVENPDNWVDWIGNHGETDDISYITKAFITGANWQKQKNESKVLTEEQCRKIRDDAFELGKDAMKQKMMAKAVDVTIAIPYQNSDGGYIQLVYSKEALLHGDNIKVLVIKED